MGLSRFDWFTKVYWKPYLLCKSSKFIHDPKKCAADETFTILEYFSGDPDSRILGKRILSLNSNEYLETMCVKTLYYLVKRKCPR